ncbi:DNA repair protein RecN [Yunchengibacter salinarum]|uniref:DNA repair protein RecN n=1 Tax=Yunchengibacter salinarum TaxID=3133399 RepID=UPI0035B665C0
MLTSLSIRDIVLIEKLDLGLDAGLTVLTGETGAGKSILLDALGLATGARADRALVRAGADKGRVIAEFSLSPDHAAVRLLEEADLENGDGQMLLRRQVSADGRSRAWINDQPVSLTLLKAVGESLLEVHGQFDDRGLLDPAGHRALLDDYGNLGPLVTAVSRAYGDLADARAAERDARAALEDARRDEEFLRHAVAELADLAPEPGEEEALADRRAWMMQGEKVMADLTAALGELMGDGGVEAALRAVMRRFERADQTLAEKVTPALESFERASIEIGEGVQALEALRDALDFDPGDLERTEERLFELRRLARKHDCLGDDLPALYDDLSARLAALDAGDETVRRAEARTQACFSAMEEAVLALRAARKAAADRLDAAVNVELAPLRLEKAAFRTALADLPPERWGPSGGDGVVFEVRTNPGSDFGPMNKVASGGELARFTLALKVVLAATGSAPVLVFDEVDKGIGGATADAVGERLHRLTGAAQVLVVTHSPQVAARGDCHYRIAKSDNGRVTRTDVAALNPDHRLEEIARMLSGATVTDEARAAARRLLT